MNRKNLFIDYFTKLMEYDKAERNLLDKYSSEEKKAILAYLKVLSEEEDNKEKPLFTDNGKLILKSLQEIQNSYNNMMKAKDIAEHIGISSKQVAGAMRKLITDGFVEKIGKEPVIYAITEKGLTINIE